MSPDAAQALALKALSWLVADEELVGVFMGSSGLSPDDLRDGAGDPAFLASVLDFLMMDDAWVIAFCDANAVDYTDPMRARQSMPGAEQVNWT